MGFLHVYYLGRKECHKATTRNDDLLGDLLAASSANLRFA